MHLPAALALGLCLLGAPLAHAQTEPTREPRRRSVTLAGSPVEVRIAPGARTFYVFNGPIRGEAIEADATLIKVVDMGEHSLITETLRHLRPGERGRLRVPLAEGKAPRWAEFALISATPEVDTEIDVVLGAPPDTACQAACVPCAAVSLAEVIASGFIDEHGVQTRTLAGGTDATSGFETHSAVSYRALNHVVVDVQLILPPGKEAWRPTLATLKSKTGEARGRVVRVEPGQENAERVRVLVETDAPPPSAGLEFTLHLDSAEGAPRVSIPGVALPPAKESKQ